jgi:orotate phosphoribosyltransferase
MSDLKDKDSLFHLLYTKAFRKSATAEFKLTSGQTSHFYVDCKEVSLTAYGAFLIGEEIFNRIKSLPVEGVGGMTLGADPIATSVSVMSHIKQKPINAFIVRKEQKQHGSGKQIEGVLSAGANLVVVEDVVTTGGSTLRTINILRSAGYTILKVVALIDRLEGGGEKIMAEGVTFEPLYTMNDFKNADSFLNTRP